MSRQSIYVALLVSLCMVATPVGVASAEDFVTRESGENVLFRQTDGQIVWTSTEGLDGTPTLIQIGPDGNVYISTSNNQDCKVWDGETGEYLGMNIQNIGHRLYGICFGPDVDDDGVEDLYTFGGAAQVVNSYTSSSGYTEQGDWVATVTTGAWAGDFGPDVTGDGVQELYVLPELLQNTNNQLTVVDGATAAELYTVAIPEVVRPGCLVAASDGRIYITGRNNDRVVSYLPDGTDPQIVVEGGAASNFSTQIAEGKAGEWYIANRFNVEGLPTDAGSVVISKDNFATTEILIAGTEAADLYNGIASFDSADAVEGPAKVYDPRNGATDVLCDSTLTWIAGEFAAGHKVYFGDTFEDVNSADDSSEAYKGEQALDNTSFDPGRMEFLKTYYWRIDEVNDLHPDKVWKGTVWSFTTEPVAYPIESVVATSNTVSEEDKGPEKVVDGSGLDEDDQHSTIATDMWAGTLNAEGPSYIQFDLDRVYKLHEMRVWNHNMDFEVFLGVGLKDVTVEYSTDGANWTVLGDVELSQAPGNASYTYNSVVALQGVAAQHIRLTINNAWGTSGQVGLSEVRIMYIPTYATEPEPADEAVDMALDTTLSWRPGRDAASHEIYLGTDPNALSLDGTTTVNTYDPGVLDLDTTTYWQVVEVNETEPTPAWASDVWSFSTVEYIEIDGFETYNDDIEAGTTIWQTWIDAIDDPSNGGSQVGHNQSPFAEQDIVHGGGQSMPLSFENTTASGFSETDRTFVAAQNWTEGAVKSLSLWFHGALGNTGQLYVAINGTKVLYDGDATDIARPQWQPWNIDLSAVGINLNSVTTLSIGVQGTGSGVVYIDDIRLYAKEVVKVTPTDPDPAGLAAHYTFDEGAGTTVNDASGNGNVGTIVGDPLWVTGILGGAMEFSGDDYVDCGNDASLQITDAITVGCWIKVASFTVSWETIVAMGDDSYRIGRGPATGNAMHFGCNGTTAGYFNGIGIVTTDTWRHVAGVYDGQTMMIYVDGVLDNSVPSTGQIDVSAYNLYIAENAQQTGRQLGGLVDDVRIYNRALSPEEMAGLAGRTAPVCVPF